MPLTKVELTNFTAFKQLEVEFSPGINVLVGANSTGKTHLMKVCYAACDVSRTGRSFTEKLVNVFLPSGRALGRLVNQHRPVNRRGKSSKNEHVQSVVQVFRGSQALGVSFPDNATNFGYVTGEKTWSIPPLESVYIPVKEMLSNAPGFLSLNWARDIHFEEVYADILHRAYLPPLRANPLRRHLLTELANSTGGRVAIKGEEFFLAGRQGRLEFSLLAEGFRKLGLLWLLIRNGSLRPGSVLFWDEPETNLNPKLYGVLIQTLLELQRSGVQIFLATHDYVILKELDLRLGDKDQIAYHALYRDDTEEIACHTVSHYLGIRPNAIMDTYTDLYDRTVERSLSGLRR